MPVRGLWRGSLFPVSLFIMLFDVSIRTYTHISNDRDLSVVRGQAVLTGSRVSHVASRLVLFFGLQRSPPSSSRLGDVDF